MEDDEDVMYEPDYEGLYPHSLLESRMLTFVDDDSGMPSMPWGWDAEEPPIARGHRHHHHHHHNRGSPWSMFPGGPPDRGMLGKPAKSNNDRWDFTY